LKTAFKQILFKLTVFFYRMRGFNIAPDCQIHPGASLCSGYLNSSRGLLTIRQRCKLSKGIVINCYGGNVKIAQNVFIGEYVILYGHGGIEIGENTLIAMHTCIISSNHTVPGKTALIRDQPDILLGVKIGRDVWIGAGAKILGGVTIGDGCVVGAGAVVTGDLPPYALAVGVPARITGFRND
jgi:acetyltransferase-like isoleucine patch superfamily enzyme